VHQLRFNSPSFTTGNVTYNIATGGAREGKKREEKGLGDGSKIVEAQHIRSKTLQLAQKRSTAAMLVIEQDPLRR